MYQPHSDNRQQAHDEGIVGSRNARAASPRPCRLKRVTTARMPRQMGTVADVRLGKADVREPTPAAMETATVRV